MWHSFPHQHRWWHSSTQDTSRQGFFTRPFLTRPEGSGVQTTPISAFLSLSILENWRWGRPGNKASDGMVWNHFVSFCGIMFISLMHTRMHTHIHTVSFVAWATHCSYLVFLCVSQPYLPRSTHCLGENKMPTRKEPGYDSLMWLAMWDLDIPSSLARHHKGVRWHNVG